MKNNKKVGWKVDWKHVFIMSTITVASVMAVAFGLHAAGVPQAVVSAACIIMALSLSRIYDMVMARRRAYHNKVVVIKENVTSDRAS